MKRIILPVLLIFLLNLPVLAQDHIRITWGGKEDHGIVGEQVQMLLDSWSRLYVVKDNGNKVRILKQP
jgi:hypothetical protein